MSILKIVRWILFCWGGVSLIGTIALAGFIAFRLGPGNRDRNNAASPHDVRFVLNWCGLGEKRIEKVIHSRLSSRSLTGDHLDVYAIKISHVDIDELPQAGAEFKGRWYRGDQLPPVLEDALEFVGGWLWDEKLSWFPRVEELRSTDFYVFPWTISCHGVRPTSVEIIFFRPSDEMVFYISAKS